MTITRIQQEHSYGCQVAVCAMLLGISYQDALKLYPGCPDANKGFSQFILDTILAEQGYTIGRLFAVRGGFGNTKRNPWPVKPWADIHWVQVSTSVGHHAIILLRDGTVLDPWCPHRVSLDDPEYHEVYHMTAVCKIP